MFMPFDLVTTLRTYPKQIIGEGKTVRMKIPFVATVLIPPPKKKNQKSPNIGR